MKTIINVCGLQRSGTTMLALMLAHGAPAVACGELAGWYRIARHRKNARLSGFWKFLDNVPEERCYEVMFNQLKVEFVIDSSKSIDWIIDVVKRYGVRDDYRIVNLLIFKNPYDQIFSAWKRRESIKTSIFRYIYYHARMLYWSGLDFFIISYNDLIKSPSRYLKFICEIVDMPYFPGKEEFWKGDYPPLFGSNEGVKKQLANKTSSLSKNKSYPEQFCAVIDKIKLPKLVWKVYDKLEQNKVGVRGFQIYSSKWKSWSIIGIEVLLRKNIFIPMYRMYLAWRAK